ncbi:conserved phage C-terminal domain-containing protein [Serratia rhizosphaerae]|uniref:Uncharacterized protein n=1 Tax=Serratia rhizosphaerae TaxID=2597702 RepID=A0ABX6GHI2_9GAMM|nr:conserved phage C-terminal domain-containing protein [Serratia rhizosphaerae]QHA85723.1 hypothetical protein FO014_01320 [Serratia rhizosphaerae]
MSLLLTSRPIVVISELAMRVGLNEAMLLQQIHYWATETTSGIEHDGRCWVYNTIAEWMEQFPFLSESSIKRAFASLKAQGIIYVEKLSSDPRDKTNFYAINYEHRALTDEVKMTPCNGSNCTDATGQSEPMQKVKMTRCKRSKRAVLHTEITTESTSKEKPTQTLPGALDSRSEWFRYFLAGLLRNQFPVTDAATLHDQVVEFLSHHGLTCRREYPVDDRGDGRGGKVDILVTDDAGHRCGVELDWKNPRRKSITKLNSIGGGLVVLRDVNSCGDYLDSGVLVIGGCKAEPLSGQAGEVLDFLNSKINGRTPKRADTLRAITERLADGYSQAELELVAEHRTDQLLNNPRLAHMLAPNRLFAADGFGAYLVAANAWQKKRTQRAERVAAVEQQRQSPPTGEVPAIDFDDAFDRLFVEGLPPANPAEDLAWQHVQKNGFNKPGDEPSARREWRTILTRSYARSARAEA